MQPQQGPGSPEYEARMNADIARLHAAKGASPLAWLRENKTLALVFLAYLAIISLWTALSYLEGAPPGAGMLLGIFVGPIVALRVYLRSRRYRQ